MNAQQWEYFVEWMYRVETLLEKLEKNTQSEAIDEKNNKITGFSAGDKP